MSAIDDPVLHVFDTLLPALFAQMTLPQELADGALMFVATAEPDDANGTRAWQLHAIEPGGPGAIFRPCPTDTPARCQVAMANQDFVALGQKQLNLEMAFMQGRLKVRGDMACAMQLGALFA